MKFKTKKQLIPFICIFLISFLLCASVTGVYISNKQQLNYTQMEHLAYTRATKVSNVISSLLYKTQVLAALVIQNNGEVADFERVASTILDSPAIKNVITAPDGIVTHVYPLEGNEALIGFDYFSDSAGNIEARLARDTGELVLGGPFTLVQGDQALVGRLPVYLENEQGMEEFWGLVSVTLYYPMALENAELEQLKEQGYAYELWRINPDNNERQIIASSNYSYNKNSRYVEQSLQIMNADWIFRISPIKEWYQFAETWIFLSTGLIISLLITFLFKHNHNLQTMHEELQNLTNMDFLTGILNRRGIFSFLTNMILQSEDPFVLCYIDINKFKHINDTYGHSVGDKVLQEFVSTLQKHMDERCILGRIGGDEFIFIIPDSDEIYLAEEILNDVRASLAEQTKAFPHKKQKISFSVGYAIYPESGTTVDELLEAADKKMYKDKSCTQ